MLFGSGLDLRYQQFSSFRGRATAQIDWVLNQLRIFFMLSAWPWNTSCTPLNNNSNLIIPFGR